MTATKTDPKTANAKPSKSKLPPPGATGTTTPGGIVANDPDATPPEIRNLASLPIQFLHVHSLDRHPMNRVPTMEQIVERSSSLKKEGQLEPLVVRKLAEPQLIAGDETGSKFIEYQILSGETRWQAAKMIGMPNLACRVIECDDARALELLAVSNAARSDLNLMQKAELIADLCLPVDQGGSGYTRQQAAKLLGLKTAEAASNIVRLLELPEVWRKRVASGDLLQSFARSLLRVAEVPAIMDELEQEWQHHIEVQASGEVVYADAFRSRKELDDQIANLIDEHLHPLDGESYYNDSELPSHLRGRYPCLVDLEQHGDKLGIVTIEGIGDEGSRKAHRYATNLDEFARLQREAIIAQAKQQKSQAAQSAGDASDDSDDQQNPIDPVEAARKRTEQLKRQIDEWADTLRRQMIAAEFANRSATDPQLVEIRLMLSMIAICELGGDFHYSPSRHLAVAVSGKPDSHALGGNWKTIYRAAERDDVAVTLDLMLSTMLTGNRELRRANFHPDVISDVFFDRLGLKMQDAWQQAQQSTSGLLDHFAQFFELHRKSELLLLARELGAVEAAEESLSKKQMIDSLLSIELPLPRSLGGKPAKKASSKTASKKAKAK